MSEITGKVSGWIGTSLSWGASLKEIATHVAKETCGLDEKSTESIGFQKRFVHANAGDNKPALPKYLGYHMVRCRLLKKELKAVPLVAKQSPAKDGGAKSSDGGIPMPDVRQVSPDLKALKPDMVIVKPDAKSLTALAPDKGKPKRQPPRVRTPRAKKPVIKKPATKEPPTKKATEALPGM